MVRGVGCGMVNCVSGVKCRARQLRKSRSYHLSEELVDFAVAHLHVQHFKRLDKVGLRNDATTDARLSVSQLRRRRGGGSGRCRGFVIVGSELAEEFAALDEDLRDPH